MNKIANKRIYSKKYTLGKSFRRKTVNIVVSGCCGKMGQVLCNSIEEKDNCKVCAGVDINSNIGYTFPTFSTVKDLTVENDVIIDFSHPDLLDSLLEFALKNKKPIVICTTGFSDEQIKKIKIASNDIPVFFSGNMSIGINLLIELCKVATKAIGSNFDIEIIEKHHNQKIDAPSGTALMLAEGIGSCLDRKVSYVYDRHLKREKRSKNEIGIHSIRGGTIVGEHEVILAGNNETISLSHSAQSKEVFAQGAINAALFLINKEPGLYNMTDLLKG